VLAALTIAAQVSASGNQQQGGLRAARRAPRFTYLAAATGGVALVGWLILALRFWALKPGPLALIGIAIVGIVFFAADAATVVLSADMRGMLDSRRRRRLRSAGLILKWELQKSEHPKSTLFVCVVSLLMWCALIAVAVVATFAVGTSIAGHNYPVLAWGPDFLQLWLILVVITPFIIPFVVAPVIAAFQLRRREYRRVIRVCAALMALVLLYLPFSLVVSAIRQGGPDATIGVALGASVLAVMLLVVSPAIRLARRSRSPWTPRGALRHGSAAMLLLLDRVDRRRMDNLTKAFTEAKSGLTTESA
ncbi:hypothetical protein ACFVUP_39660, partial [Streptomyces bacillaris]|uniref:hypothetical protein n=1 Tax=Streptomyces bacillaris TaxID=68179 RepID=UPI0036DBE50F